MMKRIISLVLCLGMIAGTLLMAGCGDDTNTQVSSDENLPMTISMVGITEKSTTPEAIDAVEAALNKISKTRYKTQIDLTLVTADQYIELVEERFAQAKLAVTKLAAIGKYNSMAQTIANEQARAQASENTNNSFFSKWNQGAKTVEASTLSTGSAYTAEETTVYENGRIETVYPSAASPIDILMIDGKEMYDYLDEKGYLLSIADKLTTDFTKFRQYIYPTFFDQLQTITDDIKAIPNNNLLAEYTYLVVDKAIADKYDFDVDLVESYADLDEGTDGFLSQVKANENVTVLATEPDALGIYTYFDGDIAVGTYYDPIYGYDPAEGTDFSVRSLFEIPQYTDHLILMEEYRNNGYFDAESEDFAVTVVKGDASLPSEYGDDYYVKVLQNPFVEMDAIFDGMIAVSSYTADATRALQIIEMINTDPEVKNLLQYGIAYDGENDDVANYRLNEIENEDGTISYSITRLNQNYMMDNSLTGNVYMGYPEEGMSINAWDYYKQTNLDSALSPFMYFYVSDADLDMMMSDILRRACLSEAFAPVGIDYDEYENSLGTNQGNTMRRNFKLYYVSFFMDCLDAEGSVVSEPLNFVTKGSGSALEADFIEFALSKEGQEILKAAGYIGSNKNAESYTKKASMSGKIIMASNIGTVSTYIDSALSGLATAYKAMYPDVEIVLPEYDASKGYNVEPSRVDGKTYTLGIIQRNLLANETNSGLEASNVGKIYSAVFNNDNHETYKVSWYEDKMIEKITAEKYSDIVSASGLTTIAKNTLASLCGIDLSKYSAASRPASESVVLANAQKSASSYYTNIAYLRIMADELLLNDEEVARFANLNAVDYETAVFDYIRANYETKNNLTEEDYVKLVQDFMASALRFYTSTNELYSVSWDDFQETKANAQIYLTAATLIKDTYADALTKKLGKGLMNLLSLPELIDNVYDIMYEDYLTENGLDKTEFENSIKDIYLGKVGSSADEFAGYTKTSDEYKNVIANLRKEYKKLLIELCGKDAYDKGEVGISNEEVIKNLFDYFLEEELGLNDKMCAIADIDYEDFAEAKTHMENYELYLSTLKDEFVYTLRTKYTASQIDAWSYEEIETNIFNVLYETGFYTNELARYIGLDLNAYMLAKSNAVTYQTYIKNLVNALSTELKELGYDPATFVKEDGDVIEEVCLEIVIDKYYGDKVSIQDVMAEASADYVKGIATATDVEAYLANAKDATSNNYFYMAVVNALQQKWLEVKGN